MHCCKAWPSATPGGGQVFCRATWLEEEKTRAVILLLLRKVSAKELPVPEYYLWEEEGKDMDGISL